MIKALLLVPLRDNERNPFSYRAFRALEDELTNLAGGVTAQGGVTGVWSDAAGRVYRDRSRQYIVALSSWRQLPEFLALVERARISLRQEAMYVEIGGIPEILS